jgi:DNA-binding transcriptional LysR family regulator
VLYLLPGPVAAFRRRFPAVELVIRNQVAEETVAMLRTGELDLGSGAWTEWRVTSSTGRPSALPGSSSRRRGTRC